MHGNRPKSFELIVFDWDGTLFDSTAVIVKSIQAAIVDIGGQVLPREKAAYVIGMDLERALAHVAPDITPDQLEPLKQRYMHHYRQHQWDLDLFEGITPMLQALKAQNYWLAVATAKGRRSLDDAFKTLSLQGLIDASRTAEETRSKPHPLMLHELMGEFGIGPESVLMVGDTTHDLQMAHNAGCACVAVSYGAHSMDLLTTCQPRFIAHSVAQLRAWLLGLV